MCLQIYIWSIFMCTQPFNHTRHNFAIVCWGCCVSMFDYCSMAANSCRNWAGLRQFSSDMQKIWPDNSFRHINVRSMDPGWEEQMSPADDKLSVNRKNTNTATPVHQECCAHKSTDMHSHSTCWQRCTKVPEASFLGLSVKPYIHTADGEKEEEKQRWII